MKYIFNSIALILILSTNIFAQTKPILLIYKADYCGPCKSFDRTMMTDRNFYTTLSSKFDLRTFNISTEEGRASANEYGILHVPAFVIFVNDKPVAKPIYGFRPSESGKAYLISSLTAICPPTEYIIENHSSQTLPDDRHIIQKPDDVKDIIRESSDETIRRIRDALTELRSDVNASLTSQEQIIKDSRDRFKGIDQKILELSDNNIEINDKISQLISYQNSADSKLNKVITTITDLNSTINTVENTTNTINRTQTSTFEEILNTKPENNTQQSKDSGLFGTLIKYGIGAAATVYGWPVLGTAAGTAALGIGIGFIRRRFKKNHNNKPLINQQPVNQQLPTDYKPYQHSTQSTVNEPTNYKPYEHPPPTREIQTENRYIVKEVDIVGESYKEAIRKLATTLGDKNPQYKEIAAIVEHTAKEIERGKRRTTTDEEKLDPNQDIKLLWQDNPNTSKR